MKEIVDVQQCLICCCLNKPACTQHKAAVVA
uniref:Uncharacterized protein n=1 Tax=Arundo donax TaxID=35708 RepID=A0A0A9DZ84_ARUDO